MFASVIFTTYNHPQWLEKTLWGFSAQSYRDSIRRHTREQRITRTEHGIDSDLEAQAEPS